MVEAISEIETALTVLGRPSPWGPDIKASEEFLDPLFAKFYKRLGLPNFMSKTDYHELAIHVPQSMIDPEIRETLDLILGVQASAIPRKD